METIYKWVILAMDTAPSDDGLTDVVKTVYYTRQGEAVENESNYLVEQFGIMGCSAPDPMAFTPYDSLTYEDVCSWLDASLDVANIDAQLDAQIQNLINPPIVQLPLPWQTQPVLEEIQVAPIEETLTEEAPKPEENI